MGLLAYLSGSFRLGFSSLSGYGSRSKYSFRQVLICFLMGRRYKIFPRVIPLDYLGQPGRGQTRPYYFGCYEVETNIYDAYLIKYSSEPEPLARESVGNALARFGGLKTPDPAVSIVSPVLVENVKHMFQREGKYSNQVQGHGAACRVFRSGQESALDDLPMTHPLEALRLYIFDMVSGNSDRVRHNPNCTVGSKGLIVFDFEQCFALDQREIVPSDIEPWRVATGGLGVTHMYHTRLIGANGVRKEVRTMLEKFTDLRLNQILDEIPRTWIPEAQRIVNHVKIIREHADDFISDVAESLK